MWNVAAFALSLALSFVLSFMAVAALLSFLAFPITTALALAGKRRCLDCRRHFPSGLDSPDPGTRSFPLRLYLAVALLIFPLCLVGPCALPAARWTG